MADVLKDWMNKGGAYEEAAVLYRSNAQSRAIEEALLRVSIPYRIYGGLRFYERLEIKNAIAYGSESAELRSAEHIMTCRLRVHAPSTTS